MLPKGISTDEKLTLRYTCLPKLYAIPPEAEPAVAIDEKNNVRTFESHRPIVRKEGPPHIGEYVITIEASISSSDAVFEAASNLSRFAQDLDKFWIYACGEPLSPVVHTITLDTTPCGWQSNMESVKEQLARASKQTVAIVKLGPYQHLLTMSCYPLRFVLNAWHAYHKVADERTKKS